MDGIENIKTLQGLGQSEARKELPKLRQLFFTKPAAAFVADSKLNSMMS